MGNPLKRLMFATIETIVEGLENEPWPAYINNTFDFSAVMFNNKKLIAQIIEAKKNPQIIKDLEKEAEEKWGKKYDNSLAKKIFQLVWAAILFKVNTIVEIKQLIQEHNSQSQPAAG